MLEKLKVDCFNKEIISELQGSIEKRFQNDLSMFKAKCEKLVSRSCANSMFISKNWRKK